LSQSAFFLKKKALNKRISRDETVFLVQKKKNTFVCIQENKLCAKISFDISFFFHPRLDVLP